MNPFWLMLGRRRGWWSSIKPALVQRLVFAGDVPRNIPSWIRPALANLMCRFWLSVGPASALNQLRLRVSCLSDIIFTQRYILCFVYVHSFMIHSGFKQFPFGMTDLSSWFIIHDIQKNNVWLITPMQISFCHLSQLRYQKLQINDYFLLDMRGWYRLPLLHHYTCIFCQTSEHRAYIIMIFIFIIELLKSAFLSGS